MTDDIGKVDRKEILMIQSEIQLMKMAYIFRVCVLILLPIKKIAYHGTYI